MDKRSFVEDGYTWIYKRENETYVLAKTKEGQDVYGIGIDDSDTPYRYTEAQQYYLDNEDKHFEYIMPQPSHRDALIMERHKLTKYLTDTDWIVVKCTERKLDIETEYPEAYVKRQEARDRIAEIDEELKG